MLLTRSPLSHPLRDNRVRLACVRHAASVDSEPGSNSHVKAIGSTAPHGTAARNCLTRAPVENGSCVVCTSCCGWSQRDPGRYAHATLGHPADTRRAFAPAPNPQARRRSKHLLCLHALSSFQRTGEQLQRESAASASPSATPVASSGEPCELTATPANPSSLFLAAVDSN